MVQIKRQSPSGRFSTVKRVSIKRQPKRRGMGANLMTEPPVYDAAVIILSRLPSGRHSASVKERRG